MSMEGAGAPPQQDLAMGAQLPENPQGQFQGGNGGNPSSTTKICPDLNIEAALSGRSRRRMQRCGRWRPRS